MEQAHSKQGEDQAIIQQARKILLKIYPSIRGHSELDHPENSYTALCVE